MHSGRKISFLLLSLGLFLYVGFRAYAIDVTIDEAASILYNESFNLNALLTTANTHWLNTLLMKVISFFTGRIFFLRLPNVLSFLLFAWGVWNLLKSKSGPIYILGLALLLCNPYVLDFFSVARGYGLCIAFMMCSISLLPQALKEGDGRSWLKPIVFAVFAMAANYSVLFYFLMLALFFVYENKFPKDRNTYINYALIFVAGAVCLTNLMLVKIIGKDLGGGGRDSFFKNTLGSLYVNSRYLLEHADAKVFWPCAMLFALMVVMGVFGLVQYIFKAEKRFVMSIIAFGLFLISQIFFSIADIPFPWYRTAVVFIPIFALMLLDALELLIDYSEKLTWVVASVFTVLAMVNFIMSMNTTYVREWRSNSNTQDILDLIVAESKTLGLKIQYASWYTNANASEHYYLKQFPDKYPIDVEVWYQDKKEEPLLNAEFAGVPIRLLSRYEDSLGLKLLKLYPQSGMALLQKKSP